MSIIVTPLTAQMWGGTESCRLFWLYRRLSPSVPSRRHAFTGYVQTSSPPMPSQNFVTYNNQNKHKMHPTQTSHVIIKNFISNNKYYFVDTLAADGDQGLCLRLFDNTNKTLQMENRLSINMANSHKEPLRQYPCRYKSKLEQPTRLLVSVKPKGSA